MVGGESIRIIHEGWGTNPKFLRATSQWILFWGDSKTPDGMPRPETWQQKVRIVKSEGVFGKSILPDWNETLQESLLGEAEIKISFPETWAQELSQQKQLLSQATKPKVIAQDGRWAYLDRGRAWGLDLTDRLVLKGSGDIRGHAIGFFGSEKKMSVANKIPIHDGAIIYIRDGLENVRVGMEVDFDPKNYP